jgi:hypothetical protein
LLLAERDSGKGDDRLVPPVEKSGAFCPEALGGGSAGAEFPVGARGANLGAGAAVRAGGKVGV